MCCVRILFGDLCGPLLATRPAWLFFMYYFVASSDSWRNIGWDSIPNGTFNFMAAAPSLLLCAEEPIFSSSTSHAETGPECLVVGARRRMDGKLLQLRFPNRQFLFGMYGYIWLRMGKHSESINHSIAKTNSRYDAKRWLQVFFFHYASSQIRIMDY